MGTQTLEIPELLIGYNQKEAAQLPWHVVLYDDPVHTINAVILQVQKATGLSLEASFEITMTVHTKGQAECFTGSRLKCEKVAAVLREIDLTVSIVC